MRLSIPLALAVLLLAAPGVPAQVAPQLAPATNSSGAPVAPVDDLIDALRLGDVLEAMRAEGIDYGESLEQDLFPDRGGTRWAELVDRVYATDAMRARLMPALERELGELSAGDVTAARDFFRAPLGQRIVALENSARLAQLDEDVKAASQQEAEDLKAGDPARYALLQRFVAANDLVEANVVGALNANAAFYFGLNAAGAFPQPLTEEEILSDVAAQADGIREETADWIDAYLALAYRPLSDADLERYLAFSESPAGRALNRAMFEAYDSMFTGLSRDLGRGAARFIAGQEL